MSILVGKITKEIYSNVENGYYIYEFDRNSTAIYKGDKPPQALKTVSYSLLGEWEKVPKYGRQFKFHKWEKVKLKSLTKKQDFYSDNSMGRNHQADTAELINELVLRKQLCNDSHEWIHSLQLEIRYLAHKLEAKSYDLEGLELCDCDYDDAEIDCKIHSIIDDLRHTGCEHKRENKMGRPTRFQKDKNNWWEDNE